MADVEQHALGSQSHHFARRQIDDEERVPSFDLPRIRRLLFESRKD